MAALLSRISLASFFGSILLVSIVLASPALAKDKNKSQIPEDILRAQTVRVVIDPGAGEPLDQPYANSTARDAVEKALSEWGRFRVVMGGESDLIVTVRTGDGRVGRPTIQGGPIDQRPGVAQGTDSTIRIGGQQGHPPTDDSSANPPYGSPRVGNEIGQSEDTFAVYRGSGERPLDSAAVWRYSAKDCLREPDVAAVEKFRKVLADAEKPKTPQPQTQTQPPQQKNP